MNTPRIMRLHRKTIIVWLSAFAAILVYIHIVLHSIMFTTGHDHLFGMLAAFDLNREQNIPTFFAALLLLINAAGIFCVAQDRRFASGWTLWGILSILLAFDEITAYHDEVINAFGYIFSTRGIFDYLWIIPVIVSAAAFGACSRHCARALPPPVKKTIVRAAGLWCAGAIGIEILGRMYLSHYTHNTAGYVVLSTIAETLKMAGSIVFLDALLMHIETTHPRLCIDLS